ncbi:uncharacterized protein LOC125745322 isoform X3 [Brienomyrus brachyistius]|uniref:uncharacterized protein LOC125745322 isoform X3 n=1 Tax=Brienomyrus brachyistius TaxID=42636 RepID=UPI0020B42E37|nr:uncharacterized protein LOC125745322 isoform X3 [Brienomyrus brachyistius]
MWGGHHAAGHAHSTNTMDYSMWGGHHAAGHAHSTNTVDYSMQGGTMQPGMHTAQTQWITVCGVAPCGRACTQHKHNGLQYVGGAPCSRACTQHKHNGLQYAGGHHAAGHAHSTNTVDYSMRGGTMRPGMHTTQTQWITVCGVAPCGRACTQHKHNGLQYAGWHHAAGHAHSTNTVDYSMQGGTMRPGMHTTQTQWITVCRGAPCGRACTQHKHSGLQYVGGAPCGRACTQRKHNGLQYVGGAPCGRACTQRKHNGLQYVGGAPCSRACTQHKHSGLQYAGGHHAAGHAHNTNTMDYSMRGGTMRPGMHTAQTQWITVCGVAPCGRACTQHKHSGLQYAGGAPCGRACTQHKHSGLQYVGGAPCSWACTNTMDNELNPQWRGTEGNMATDKNEAVKANVDELKKCCHVFM